LLGQCENLIKKAFAIKIDTPEYRGNLRFRAMNLKAQLIEPRLRSFLLATCEGRSSDKSWLESLMLIISGKPPKSWRDEDVMLFESKLSDMARRFLNLELLQKEIAVPSEGIDARRITITYSVGDEIHEMLWIDRKSYANLEQLAEKIIESYGLLEDSSVRQGLGAVLVEKLFDNRGSNEELILDGSKNGATIGQ